MPQAKSNEALKKQLKIPIAEAVEYTMNKILESNPDMIQKYVYEVYKPEYYNRTGDFEEAWETAVHTTAVGTDGHLVRGDFFYKPSNMDLIDADNTSGHLGSHTSFNGQDVRKYLADIIYQGYATNPDSAINPNGGTWERPRNAFEKLSEYIGKKRLRDWMAEGLRAAGLNIKVFVNVDIKKEKIE